MIYFTTSGDQAVLIIEPGNIVRLMSGKPMHTPDKRFLVCYTPDMAFVQAELEKAGFPDNLDVTKLDDILKQSLERAEVPQ